MLKMGAELRQMYGSATNTNNYIRVPFSSLLNFANDQALQMTRYVDPPLREPVTAYSELTQTEWAVSSTTTGSCAAPDGECRLRYENYGTFKDSDGTLRNIVFGPERRLRNGWPPARVDFVGKFYPTDNNNIGPRLGFAWDPSGERKNVRARGGYGLAFEPAHESPGGELSPQPAASRLCRARPVLRHAQQAHYISATRPSRITAIRSIRRCGLVSIRATAWSAPA